MSLPERLSPYTYILFTDLLQITNKIYNAMDPWIFSEIKIRYVCKFLSFFQLQSIFCEVFKISKQQHILVRFYFSGHIWTAWMRIIHGLWITSGIPRTVDVKTYFYSLKYSLLFQYIEKSSSVLWFDQRICAETSFSITLQLLHRGCEVGAGSK